MDEPIISTSSDESRSFADGTAAEAAAPKAVRFCPGGVTSLRKIGDEKISYSWEAKLSSTGQLTI